MTMIPRKYDSEIKITEAGLWFFRGQEITQKNILDFFKKNTREDELGIYITNSYAGLVEHGYLETEDIFLKNIDSYTIANTTFLVGEDEIATSVKEFFFYSDTQEKLFCMRKSDRYLKFRFNRHTHSFISSLMVEENGYYFLKVDAEKIPIIPYNKPIAITIPEKYRSKVT